jgi:type IV pilus assembly protein PilN
MIRINLLPHREEKRKERRQQFALLAVVSALIGGTIVLAVHVVNAGYIGTQEERNQIFRTEIAKLDQEIAEIKELRDKINDLLSRKRVIENLQSNRADTVHLFNELAVKIPVGVYLTSVKQAGGRITLGGYAQSNARVSTMMRSLDDSPFLKDSALVETKAATVNGRRVSQFTLNVTIERPSTQSGEVAGAEANRG